MKMRRLNCCVVALCLAALGSVPVFAAAGKPGPTEQAGDAFKQQRREAANRKRRVIFNNDGDEIVYECREATLKALLDARTTALAGTQVDSIFYCTWSSGMSLFTHDTKAGQVFDTREGRFAPNMTRAMLDRGIDPLKAMVDFGKEHRMEVFWSYRMNDTHDGALTDYGPVMFRANKLKTEHPEYLMGDPKHLPKYGAWSAMNYGLPEVRELAFRYVEEVCQNYDVDGVELDFFRHPVFFKHNTAGAPCDDADREQMTGLVRRIREMTEAVGRKRGRPILVAMRVPDSVEYSRAVGIDLEQWLAGDLLDLLIVSSYLQLNAWEYSVQLGHKYGVKVYPSLDESRVKDPDARALRMSPLAYRGRAMNVWNSGADGVYIFNHFNPLSPVWRELGDPAQLQNMDKDYFASVRGVAGVAGSALPHSAFIKIATLNPASPIPLADGREAEVKFPIGDKVRAGDDAAGTTLTLRLRLKDLQRPEAAAVKMNGNSVPNGSLAKDWVEFKLDPKWVRQGANEVTVTPALQDKGSLTDLHLTVRHK